MRWALLGMLLGAACGGSRADQSLTGTWFGQYGSTSQGTLQLTETGSAVAGTLTTSTGRSATVSGSVTAQRFSGTFTFTDSCIGTASTTADIVNSGNGLTGNYTASDCLGTTTGGYSLSRQ